MIKVTVRDDERVWPRKLYENGQANPLRWKIMFFDEESGSFIDQARWMKCKDYFNDVVAYFCAKVEFDVCGFNNKTKFNDNGLWVLLKYLHNREQFKQNLQVLNAQLHKDTGEQLAIVEPEAKDEILVWFPQTVLTNTYRMSLFTMAIRRSNWKIEFKKWEDFWTGKINEHELSFPTQVCEKVKINGFKVPEKYADYWYYGGPQYNSKVLSDAQLKIMAGSIHNNGCRDWCMRMEPQGVDATSW